MADTTKKIVYLDLLKSYDTKIKSHIADKISKIPNEQFLKEAGTQFVQTFAWSEETYPGSVNPELDGQPVLVLALATKTLNAETGAYDETTTYSFLAMKSLVDVYKAGADTSTVKVTVNSETNEITAAVRVSAAENNALETKEDGLFINVTAKANKLAEATVAEGQVLVDDGAGDLKGSGYTIGTGTVSGTTEGETTTYSDKKIATEAAVMAEVAKVEKKVDSLEYATEADIDALFTPAE